MWQHEHNACVPPTSSVRVMGRIVSASDLAAEEQDRALQREREKQARIDAFRYTLQKRVAQREMQNKNAVFMKEKAVEETIQQRVNALVGYPDKSSFVEMHSKNVYITQEAYPRPQRTRITSDNDLRRLYTNVREASMNQERAETQQWARRKAEERRYAELREQLGMEEEALALEEAEADERIEEQEVVKPKRPPVIISPEAEYKRYAKALQQQFLDHLETQNVTIPPICPCSKNPLSHNPKDCFINCIYLNKPIAYRNALTEVMSKLKIQAVVL